MERNNYTIVKSCISVWEDRVTVGWSCENAAYSGSTHAHELEVEVWRRGEAQVRVILRHRYLNVLHCHGIRKVLRAQGSTPVQMYPQYVSLWLLPDPGTLLRARSLVNSPLQPQI